jgi:hypothetical protein
VPSTVHDILNRLAAVRSALLRVEFRSGSLWFFTFLATLLSVSTLAEMLFHFNAAGRTMIALMAALMIAGAKAWLILRPALKMLGLLAVPSDSSLAAFVGTAFPEIRDRLLNVLQLHEQRQHATLYSNDLIEASLRDLSDSVRELDFTSIVDPRPARSAGKAAAICVATMLLLFAVTPTPALDAVHRLLHFDRDFVSPPRFVLAVQPGDTEIIKGASVTVSVSVSSADGSLIPDSELRVFWKPEGQEDFESRSALPDSQYHFQAPFSSLHTSTDYYVQFSDVQSRRFRITVIDRPLMRSFLVRLMYPAYTHLAPTLQDEFVGDIAAVAGTLIRLEGTASKSLQDGSIILDPGGKKPLQVQSNRFSGSFRLLQNGHYHINISDTDGLSNENPVSYTLKAVADNPPTIILLEPGRNVDIAGTSALRLLIRISDDFGFSALKLGFRLVHSRYEQPQENYLFRSIPFDQQTPGLKQADVPYLWDFSDLGLVPEDVVEYFVEVTDNNAVTGPKSARSGLFLLRLPSLEEVFTDLDREHVSALDELARTRDDARELRTRIESLSEDFKKNKEMDWQQQKKLEETARKYQDLQKKLDDLRERVETMTEEMSRQNVLSAETMEKYLQLQQLFEELNSTELQEALKRLQQAMQGLNKQQLLQALQQVTFSEERFRQSIERTLDLLKRIQIEQKLDELRKRAEELSTQQQELWETIAGIQDSASSLADLAQRQKDLREKLNRLEAAGGDLQRRMEEFFTEMPEEELQNALRKLDSLNVAGAMNRATERLQAAQPSEAARIQQAIGRALGEFNNDLSQIQMQMLQRQQQYIVNELRRTTRNLLELSVREEHLKSQSESAPPQSQQLRQNALDQIRIVQDLQNVTSALQELARRSFAVTPEMARAIGEAFRNMYNALSALDTRNAPSASQEQRLAMESLNKAAMAVQQSLQTMLQQSGGQGAGSLMQQLQNLAGKQMSINARTLAAEEAARLSVEQQAVQKSLERLSAEARASGKQQRILGDLERIAEEMKEVVRNLEQNDVNPETIRKQERILSRLLDASRSTRERDFEKKRRSRPGQNVGRPGPDELDPETLLGKNKLREDLLRALEHRYSRDYEDLIKKYFEELQKAETQMK